MERTALPGVKYTNKQTLEKADALRTEVLGRFSAEDDQAQDPLTDWDGTGNLNWEQTVSRRSRTQHHRGHKHLPWNRPSHGQTAQVLLGPHQTCYTWAFQPLSGSQSLPPVMEAG